MKIERYGTSEGRLWFRARFSKLKDKHSKIIMAN
jgi:hypothetical protein